MHRKVCGLLMGFMFAMVSLPEAFSQENTPEFLISSNTPQPESTFEVRFPKPVVDADAIGKDQPVAGVFEPAISGTWRWSSERSAVFTPDSPLPLGTKFVLKAVAPGSKTRPVAFNFNTPAPGVSNVYPSGGETSQTAPEPRIQLLLNSAIDPSVWAGRIFFVNEAGKRIPADVVPSAQDQYFPTYIAPGQSLLSWRDRFFFVRNEPSPEAPGINRITVSPRGTLATGTLWSLVVPAGLPVLDGVKTAETWKQPVGRVMPFEVSTALANSTFGGGRRIVVEMSKPLFIDSNTPTNYADFVSITPAVENLVITPEYKRLVITGDLLPDAQYRITLASGLPSSDGSVLKESKLRPITMPRMQPRLMVPDYDEAQLAGGRRKFDILSVNNGKVRLRVKRLDPAQTIATLTEYAAREVKYEDDGSDNTLPMGFDAAGGTVVFDEVLDLSAPTDELVAKTYEVDKFLNGAKSGVLYFDLASVDQKPETGVQAISQITDIGLVWKRGTSSWLAYAHRLSDAAPLPGTEVRLMDAAGKEIAAGTTDASAAAVLPRTTEGTWLMLKQGEDFLVTRIDEERVILPRYAFELPLRFDDPGDRDISVLLFSDRGVYRPGDELFIRGIARQWKDGLPTRPVGDTVSLSIIDPRGRNVHTEEIKLDADGSFEATVDLPEGPTGFYRARALVFASVEAAQEASGEPVEEYYDEEENSGMALFQIQDYQPAAFELSMEADLSKAPLATIQARYQTGEPVVGAKVEWSGEISASYPETPLPGFRVGVGEYDARIALQTPMPATSLTGSLELGATGSGEIALPLEDLRDHPVSLEVLVSAEVTDPSQQTISKAAAFPVNAGSEYLGLSLPGGFIRIGAALPMRIAWLNGDGLPMDDTIQGTWRLLKVNNNTVREEIAGGGHRYVQQVSVEETLNGTFKSERYTEVLGRWLNAEKVTPQEITPTAAGSYYLVVNAESTDGRKMTTGFGFDVAGEEAADWSQDVPYKIELSTDRDEYNPGDTAKVLVKTPIAGQALVTVERENVTRHFVVPVTGESPVVEVPISAADCPNTFISVLVMRGANQSTLAVKIPDYRVGYARIFVRDPARELTTSVSVERRELEPRQEVKTTVAVSDVDGKPVANANVTLYAVDEGVLALTDYKTPDPLRFFYRLRSLFVQTGLTIPNLRQEDGDNLMFWNKGFVIGGGGLEGADIALRTNFAALAFWSVALRTTADGLAIATFPAPDALTRYRVMAVVQEGDGRFGAAQDFFAVRKPFMIKPSLPALTRVGDKINARVLLQNTLPDAGKAEIRLKVEGPAQVDGEASVSNIAIDGNGLATVDIPVNITGVGPITWTWEGSLTTADGRTARDGMQDQTLSRRVVPLSRSIQNPQIGIDPSSLLASIDPVLLASRSVDVRVSISNSRLIDLREGVEQLLVYPYGCVEQTTSSLIPWLTLGPLQKVIPELQVEDRVVQRTLNKGLARLWSMQTRDGGLSYWPGNNESMLWGSAYAAIAIGLARDQGIQEESTGYNRLKEYLSTSIRNAAETKNAAELEAQVMAVAALSTMGAAEPAYHEVLFKRRKELSLESRRFLALAIAGSSGPEAMVRNLLADSNPPQGTTSWFGSTERLRALELMTLATLGAPIEELDKAFDAMLQGSSNGHWRTTQGNAWSILAAISYHEANPSASDPVKAVLTWQGKSENVTPDGETLTIVRDFTGGNITPEMLTASVPEGGRIYSEVRLEAELDKAAGAMAENHGFSLVRSYTRLAGDGSVAEDQRLVAGDKVLVTLVLNASADSEYVAIEDPLPALFEPINPDLATQAAGGAVLAGFDNSYLQSYRELREDRAIFFADELPAGQHVIRYLARVRHTGTATAPGTQAECMYDPDVRGRTTELVVNATPQSRP